MGLFDRLMGKKAASIEFPATLRAMVSGTFVPVVTNSDDFSSVEEAASGKINGGDAILRISE